MQLFKGQCNICGKIIIEDEEHVVFSGNPPEFPQSIKGHCGYVLPMDYYYPTEKELSDEMSRYENDSKEQIKEGLKEVLDSHKPVKNKKQSADSKRLDWLFKHTDIKYDHDIWIHNIKELDGFMKNACVVNKYSSRICEFGTKSCVIKHKK